MESREMCKYKYKYKHKYKYNYRCFDIVGLLPCLLLLLLVVEVEGIFKWNPGKCAKSHHAILHKQAITNCK